MHQFYVLCWSGRVCGGECEGGRWEGGRRERSVKEGGRCWTVNEWMKSHALGTIASFKMLHVSSYSLVPRPSHHLRGKVHRYTRLSLYMHYCTMLRSVSFSFLSSVSRHVPRVFLLPHTGVSLGMVEITNVPPVSPPVLLLSRNSSVISGVCPRHCSIQFMKQVLPKFQSPTTPPLDPHTEEEGEEWEGDGEEGGEWV